MKSYVGGQYAGPYFDKKRDQAKNINDHTSLPLCLKIATQQTKGWAYREAINVAY